MIVIYKSINNIIRSKQMLQDNSNGESLLSGGNSGKLSGTKVNSTNAIAASSPPRINNEVIQSDSNIKERSGKEKKKSKKDETQFTSVLKFFNIIIGMCVMAFGGACYKFFNEQTTNLDYVGIILPGYIAFSGLIILLLQCNIGFIIRNMRFLYNFIGRGLFNIYVGVMPLSLIRNNANPPQNQIFQVIIYIMVSLMCLIGVLYILAKIFCCAKEDVKKKKRKNSSQSEDSD